MFLDEVKRRKERVENLIKKLESSKKVRDAVKGQLQTGKCNGFFSYRIKDNDTDKRRYLCKDELDEAKRIIQRDYDNEIFRAAKFQLKAYNALIKCLEKFDLEAIYTALPLARRALVKPYVVPFEEYAKQWQEKPYYKLPFLQGDGNFKNSKGERMRSRAECIICNLLIELGIPYKYDYPIQLEDGKEVFIDFVILKRSTREEKYMEHFGLMSDPGYVIKAMRKLKDYPKIGLILGDNFFFTFETDPDEVDFKAIKDMMIKNFI